MTSAKRQVDRESIRQLLAGRYPRLIAIAGLSGVGGLIDALFLLLITQTAFTITDSARDQVELAGLSVDVSTAIGLALVIIMVRVSLSVLLTWQSSALTSSVTASIRSGLSSAFLRASWATQHGQKLGRLQHLLTNFTQRGTGLVSSFTGGVSSGFSLLALLLSAVLIDPAASLVAVVVVLVLGVALRPLRSMIRAQSQKTTRTGEAFATSVSEISQLGMEMHVFNVQPQLEDQIAGLIVRNESAVRRLSILSGLLPAIYGGLAYVALVVALAVMTSLDTTDLGSAGAAMIIMLRSLTYGKSLQSASAEINAALPFVNRLRSELEKYRTNAMVDSGGPVGTLGTIGLHDVSFEYLPGQPVLRHVSAEIQPREIIGVVGPSGSGKSTLVQLLLGLRPPTGGRVSAGGRDIASFSRREWARKVTFVPQAAHLVAGTVAENIRFYRDDVSPADIERAARLAHLHDDVMAFPEGYERQVGESGGELSGGQQQRLIIARALVERPELLVLDEPTSSLDVRSESLIRQTLDQLREEMTIVIIAHRLSTLDSCDRIMVIQDGELKGFDSPGQLEMTSDFYREALVLSGLR